MGRVSKYKKIKSCDPYSKHHKKNGLQLDNVGVWGLGDNGRRPKKRSKTALKLKAQQLSKKKRKSMRDAGDGFDLPVEKDEFDLSDLMGSVKKQALPKLEASETIDIIKSTSAASMARSLQDEQKEAKLLKLDPQIDADKQRKADLEKSMQRQAGESKNAYKKRTKAETRQIIQKTSVSKRKTAKLEKKKEFLKAKKLKKKGRFVPNDQDDDGYDSDIPPALQQQQQNASSDSSGGFITGERAVAAMAAAARDEPVFGEQAERPPIFRQLPRGAQKLDKKHKKTGNNTNMSSEQIEGEQNAMEIMRRKVQAQYAALRARRRQGGGERFHL